MLLLCTPSWLGVTILALNMAFTQQSMRMPE